MVHSTLVPVRKTPSPVRHILYVYCVWYESLRVEYFIRCSIKCKKWVTRCHCVSHENIHNLLMGIITETRIVSSNPYPMHYTMSRKRHNSYKPKPSFRLTSFSLSKWSRSFRLILYYSPKGRRRP